MFSDNCMQICKRVCVYLLLVLTIFISMEILYLLLGLSSSRLLRHLVDALLFAFPALCLRRKRFLLPYLFFFLAYLFSISCYFKTYHTIMPLSSYCMVGNLKGLGPSVLNSIYWSDFLITLPVVCFVIFYVIFERKNHDKQALNSRKKLNWCRLICLIFIMINIFPVYIFPKEFAKNPDHLFTVAGLKAFKQFGFIHFWIYQFQSYQGISQKDKEYAEDFMRQKSNFATSEVCNSLFHDKNLILILVESLGSWPINLCVEGVEVTPNLNKLLAKQNTVFFPKVLPQVKDGRSSDAQLILNTGLLPLNTGAMAVLYGQNTFYSLAKALQERGYETAMFTCDEKFYWNQEATAASYGFRKLYDALCDSGDKQKADEELFENACLYMKQLNLPFYAQVVTYSTHQPYDVMSDFQTPLYKARIKDDQAKYYLASIQKLDQRLGAFLEKLKVNRLYDNSIIVITGDHDETGFNHYEGRTKTELSDRFIPFIILNSPIEVHENNTNKVVGQMDIFPSLLELMCVHEYPFKGLGRSCFSENYDGCAVYHTGEAVGVVNDSIVKCKRELWRVSDALLRMNYFNNH